MMTLNNCDRRVDLDVWHVVVSHDRYFDPTRVEEHLRRIYKDFHLIRSHAPSHAPTIIADAKMAEPFVPAGLRELLRQPPAA